VKLAAALMHEQHPYFHPGGGTAVWPQSCRSFAALRTRLAISSWAGGMVGDVGMRRTISDYHSILVNAISALEKRNAEAREELYEQARAALIADFNRLDPPLSELDVLEERFKLNLAIHDFEFSAATGLN
jgi:hypothetical protein